MRQPALLGTLALLIVPNAVSAQGTERYEGPIIDMHLHAHTVASYGPEAVANCTADEPVVYPGLDPRHPMTLARALSPCDSPIWSAATDEELLRETLAVMERHNIVRAVVGGPLEEVTRWHEAAPERIIPAVSFLTGRASGDRAGGVEDFRRLIREGRIEIFAEVGAQYEGLAPNDPSLDPFYGLAEELDIPIGMHLGEGPPGAAYDFYPNYRAALGRPLLLEEVLIRHPRMRIYVMHAGWPLIEEMMAILYSHPQVYVDIAGENWGLPRKEFHRYLQRLVEAGFGQRILFGSDQMVWPQTIGVAIESIQSADFLSLEQKQDIFYNNASRFLRLSEEEIALHHGREAAGTPEGSIPQRAPAANPDDPVDAHIYSLMAERQIPGLSLVVVKDGSIIKKGHYGLANVELNVPVEENTSFMIASMSKAFTAAALMLLVDAGTVGLDDPVTDYFDDLPPTWGEITIRQLLNNTAGISSSWRMHPPGADDFFLSHTTDEAFLRALADVPLLFTPGDAYYYADGTFVVSMLIEKVSSMPYAEFMRTRIFEPLGMTRTMINDASRIVPHRASGYRVEDGVLTRGRRISPAAEARGDVGVLTTALDLAKWDAAFRDTRLLSQSSLDAMSTPAQLNDGRSFPYGLGWALWPFRGYRVIHHSGTFRTGYSSEIVRFPQEDLTVIVVANLHAALGSQIGSEIAGFYSAAYRPISSMTPRPDPDPERSRMLRSVLGVVGSGIHDPERLTPGFPISLYTHSRWQERHSGLQSFTFVDCQDRSASGQPSDGEAIHEACFYHFSDGQDAGYLVYSLARDGKVADLYTEGLIPHP